MRNVSERRRHGTAWLLLFCGLSFPPSADAAQITKIYGPIHVRGFFAPMKGPDIRTEYIFEKSGWLRSFSTTVLDKDQRPADQKRLCHSVLSDEKSKPSERSFHLMTVDEGKNELVFPEGSGPRITAGRPYGLWMMLQSPDPATDADYYFKVVFDVANEDEGAALETLNDVKIYVPAGPGRPSVTPGWDGDFWVPPGRHDYSQPFTVPYSGSIRVISPHVHEHAVHVSVLDLTTKSVLWETPIANGGGPNQFHIPVYSDKKGIPIFKDHRYEFTATYDNPLRENLPAMANIRLFISRDP